MLKGYLIYYVYGLVIVLVLGFMTKIQHICLELGFRSGIRVLGSF